MQDDSTHPAFSFPLAGWCTGAKSAHQPYSRTHRLCIIIHPQAAPKCKKTPSRKQGTSRLRLRGRNLTAGDAMGWGDHIA